MRYLLLLALLISFPATAAHVTCYDGGKAIYHGNAWDMQYDNGIVSFTEANTNAMIFTNANCIITIRNVPNRKKA